MHHVASLTPPDHVACPSPPPHSGLILPCLSTFELFRGVRTKTVKRHSRLIVEKYYSRLTLDFHTNKRVVGDVAVVPSKRMRNKIAGFTTHLMKRIQAGPVRGISLKLQEEERERRLDFVPEVSALDPSVRQKMTLFSGPGGVSTSKVDVFVERPSTH